jgi:glycosyltransferase involved in cell wall biosynthesis
MPEFSIIVPVYCVEKVFRRCLDSVVNQTFSDFECILVDDCSPDNSPAICDEYVARDNRFVVIHKKQNEGLPKARKSGLDVARGEFVTHLDSDDWLNKDTLKLLHDEFVKTNADVVKGSFKRVLKNVSITSMPPDISDSDLSVLEYYFLNDVKTIWGGAYRKILFDEYIVPPVYMGEDIITNVQIFSKLNKNKIKIIDSVIYNYDMYKGGISKEKNLSYDSFNEYPAGFCRLWTENYIRSIGVDSKVLDAFNYFMITDGIIPYIRFNSAIKPKEIYTLYEKYYLPCSYKNKVRIFDRLCLLSYVKCNTFGKVTLFFLNFFAKIVRKIKGV